MRDLHAGGQRALAGGLDDRAVRHRVGERHADLDQVGAGSRHAAQQRHRGGAVRVPGLEERDQRPAACVLQRGEARSNPPPPLAGGGRGRWLGSQLHPQMLGDGEDVLVASPAQIHQDDLVLAHRRRELRHMRQRMRRLQRRNDALGPRAKLERRQRLLVGRRHVLDAADIMQPGMLRPDARIIQPGADRVRLDDLPVIVLQQIGAVAVQHARPPAGQARGMLAGLDAVPARLHADQPHRRIIEERMEQPHRVRSAADARHRGIRQPALGFLQLRLGFLADHRLEVAHHHRIRMRAGDGADQVIGVLDIGDPVAQRLVHRVLQRGRARGHRLHLGAQQLHAEHVGLLPLDVGGAHVDGAGQAEQRAHRGGGDAMLAGAGLGDDARLAHAPGQQDLAHAVVRLVAAGVVQLVALEVDFRAAELPGQPLGEPQRAGPADIVLQIRVQFGLERRIGVRREIGLLDLQDQRHQRLGDETAAEFAEPAAPVRAVAQAVDAEGWFTGENLLRRAS